MDTGKIVVTAFALLALLTMPAAAASLQARIEGNAVVVSVDGRLFTRYTFDHSQKYPYFWPVNGPVSGKSITTETSEPYPHHHSLFFGCDRVNSGNYWQDINERGQILSQGPRLVEASGNRIVFTDECLWDRPVSEPVIRDRRRIVITAPSENLRLIDFQITLSALTDIRILKTNHSLFSARVMPEMSVKAGGTLVNSQGNTSEEGTFGVASPWCDYSGTRGGVTEGIAILQHPANRWYPAKWFTRDYGFFSPTPMYWLKGNQLDLAMGETLTLSYRVVVHSGNARNADIAGLFDAYQQADVSGNHASASEMGHIGLSRDGRHFVVDSDGRRFVPWGFNYDHDEAGRLLEDYWDAEWPKVQEDFREMKELGANVVRIHLQLGKFMQGPDKPNPASLERVTRLVELAEESGLYLDITGLGCYHKSDVPDWYDALPEKARWEVQARFWEAVAACCAESPAIFCYDLMNEPIVSGAKKESEWLAGEFAGKHFVQRISLDLHGRTSRQVAKAWVDKLVAAIRKHDDRHLITVGAIPWVRTFPKAKPLFYSPEVSRNLDFVSVHFYPDAGKVDEALTALAAYDIGKPLVIEETFPLRCGADELGIFIERSRGIADGWIGFYWGRKPEQYRNSNKLADALALGWLELFQSKVTTIK